MECNKCGTCCYGLFVINHVGILSSQSYDYDPSIKFIRKHWKLLSQEERLKRAYWLHDRDCSKDKAFQFFECDQYDEANKLCTCYDDRPIICSHFPVYKSKDCGSYTLPPMCGYVVKDDNEKAAG